MKSKYGEGHSPREGQSMRDWLKEDAVKYDMPEDEIINYLCSEIDELKDHVKEVNADRAKDKEEIIWLEKVIKNMLYTLDIIASMEDGMDNWIRACESAKRNREILFGKERK